MKTLGTASRDVRTQSSDLRHRNDRNCVHVAVKIGVCVLALALLPALRTGAQSAQDAHGPQQWKLPDIPWAFPVRDKVQPVIDERSGQLHVPGSSKAYTQEQIDDLANPPDWFPDEHAPMPKVVAHGAGGDILGCASCHLGSGLGHPESANLAGVSATYILRQLADFKARRRMGEAMNDIARDLSDQDAQEASEWFARLKPSSDWQKVAETDRVPKTFVNEHLMRMPLPGGGDEPIGNRIIELPQDIARAESRDPHSGFIAYVPKGSIAKGKELVETGAGGRTISCPICHGPDLGGLAEVPAIAGHSPLYLFRQLYYFKDGSRNGSMSALMKGVVKQLTQDDMLALAAYVGSLPPALAQAPGRDEHKAIKQVCQLISANPPDFHPFQFIPKEMDFEGLNRYPQVEYVVHEDGKVSDVKILKGTGSAELDTGLVKSVEVWKYKLQPGCTVETSMVVTIDIW